MRENRSLLCLPHTEVASLNFHQTLLVCCEEFSVVTETGQLKYRWEAQDPEYWLEPVSSQLLLSPTSLRIGTFDCQVMGAN